MDNLCPQGCSTVAVCSEASSSAMLGGNLRVVTDVWGSSGERKSSPACIPSMSDLVSKKYEAKEKFNMWFMLPRGLHISIPTGIASLDLSHGC